MFTGIVEEIGRVAVVEGGEASVRLTVECRVVHEAAQLVARHTVWFGWGERIGLELGDERVVGQNIDLIRGARSSLSDVDVVEGVDQESLPLVELGEQLYRSGVADRGVPACIACHGPAGKVHGLPLHEPGAFDAAG